MMNWEEKANELHRAANRIEYLKEIYEKVENEMQWNAMKWHDADEEHTMPWFTAPEEDDYDYEKYLTYEEVLATIVKLAK